MFTYLGNMGNKELLFAKNLLLVFFDACQNRRTLPLTLQVSSNTKISIGAILYFIQSFKSLSCTGFSTLLLK